MLVSLTTCATEEFAPTFYVVIAYFLGRWEANKLLTPTHDSLHLSFVLLFLYTIALAYASL